MQPNIQSAVMCHTKLTIQFSFQSRFCATSETLLRTTRDASFQFDSNIFFALFRDP